MRPPIILRTVVLPQPLGPRSAVKSPLWNSKETSFTAATGCPAAWKVLETCRTRPKDGGALPAFAAFIACVPDAVQRARTRFAGSFQLHRRALKKRFVLRCTRDTSGAAKA